MGGRVTVAHFPIKSKVGFYWAKIYQSFYYGLYGMIFGGGLCFVVILILTAMGKTPDNVLAVTILIPSVAFGVFVMVWLVWKNTFFVLSPGKTIQETIAELPTFPWS